MQPLESDYTLAENFLFVLQTTPNLATRTFLRSDSEKLINVLLLAAGYKNREICFRKLPADHVGEKEISNLKVIIPGEDKDDLLATNWLARLIRMISVWIDTPQTNGYVIEKIAHEIASSRTTDTTTQLSSS